jgi:hypothetical protein
MLLLLFLLLHLDPVKRTSLALDSMRRAGGARLRGAAGPRLGAHDTMLSVSTVVRRVRPRKVLEEEEKVKSKD